MLLLRIIGVPFYWAYFVIRYRLRFHFSFVVQPYTHSLTLGVVYNEHMLNNCGFFNAKAFLGVCLTGSDLSSFKRGKLFFAYFGRHFECVPNKIRSVTYFIGSYEIFTIFFTQDSYSRLLWHMNIFSRLDL